MRSRAAPSTSQPEPSAQKAPQVTGMASPKPRAVVGRKEPPSSLTQVVLLPQMVTVQAACGQRQTPWR